MVAQLRASRVETLGITTDKCSAMLRLLSESCIPYELLVFGGDLHYSAILRKNHS